MAYLVASQLVKYNANSRGTFTGDCVCRAISFAYQKPYDMVKKALNSEARELHADDYRIKPVWGNILSKYGYKDSQKVSPAITVDEFCDQNPQGIFILLVDDKAESNSTSHMVCVSDNKVYDSWDSRDWYVKYYYLIDGSIELSDIGDHILELQRLAESVAKDQVEAQATKYGMRLQNLNIGHPLFIDNYSVTAYIQIKIDDFKVFSKSYDITIVFTPTMSFEEAKAKVEKMVKVKVYDRMYELHKSIEAEREGYELLQQGGGASHELDMRWWSGLERRFYNSLPGWVKPFITYLSVQSPGQYWSSYELRFKPLPGDPNQSNVSLDAYDSQEMKVRLEEYKKNYERSYPYFDYY